MTKQITKQQANKLIAEKVMRYDSSFGDNHESEYGWNPQKERFQNNGTWYKLTRDAVNGEIYWNPAEDRNRAFEALEKWCKSGDQRLFQIVGILSYLGFTVGLSEGNISYSGTSKELPIAICTALLQAVGEDVTIEESE